jgi:hypothetical protein
LQNGVNVGFLLEYISQKDTLDRLKSASYDILKSRLKGQQLYYVQVNKLHALTIDYDLSLKFRNCLGVSVLTLKSNETHTEGTRRLANSTPRIPFGPGVARMRWMAVSDLFPQGASVSSWPTKPLSSGNTLFQNL